MAKKAEKLTTSQRMANLRSGGSQAADPAGAERRIYNLRASGDAPVGITRGQAANRNAAQFSKKITPDTVKAEKAKRGSAANAAALLTPAGLNSERSARASAWQTQEAEKQRQQSLEAVDLETERLKLDSLNRVAEKLKKARNEPYETAEDWERLQENYLATSKQAAETQKLIQAAEQAQKAKYYAGLSKNPDFQEKSQYRSTANGQEKLNYRNGTYSNSGFDDIRYDYINRNEEARSRQQLSDIQSNAAFLGLDSSERMEMTDDEIATFNYLYAQDTENGDPEHKNAYDYIQYLTGNLNARQRERSQTEWRKYAEEHPVGSSVFSVLESPLKGVSYLGQAADYLSDGKLDQNEGYNKFSYINSAIRDQVNSIVEDKWGGVGSFAYQTGMSMGDFLLNTAITGGNQALSLGIMGTGAAADATISAKDRGLSDGKAFTLGTIAGAAEILTEKVSLEALLDKTTLNRSALGYFLKNTLAEGSEEVASDVINLVADVLISKNESEWKTAVAAYKTQGMTDSEAFWRAVRDQALNMGLDFLGGAVSGGVMAGAGIAINKGMNAYNARKTGREFQAMGSDVVEATIQEGLESDPSSQSYQQAQQLQQKLDAGQSLTNAEVGKLYQSNVQAIAAEEGSGDLLQRATDEAETNGRISNNTALDILENPTALETLTQETGLTLTDGMTKSQQRGAVKTAVDTLVNRRHADFALEGEATAETTENRTTGTQGHGEVNVQAERRSATDQKAENFRQIREAAATFGGSGGKAMVAGYDGEMRPDLYYAGFAAYYNAGLRKADTAEVNSDYGGLLTKAQQFAAYAAGKNDAEASLKRERQAAQYARTAGTDSGLVYDDFVRQAVESGRPLLDREGRPVKDANGETRTYLTAEAADKVNRVAKALGLRARFADSVNGGNANAQIQGSEVLIEKDNENPVMFLIGHEITHRMQELSPDQYRTFRNLVAGEEQGKIQKRIDAYAKQGETLSWEQAVDEAAADYAGRMIDEGKVLDDFIERHREDRTLLQKVRDAIRALIDKLTGAEKKKAQTAEGKLTAALEAAAKQAKNLQNQESSTTIGEPRNSSKGKYWRPNLTQKEWSVLNRHMEQEISDPAHTLDAATQWAYAEEKGNRVFAIYGVGDGTEATPLYAVGGKKATAAYEVLQNWMEGNNGETDRTRKNLYRIFENFKGKSRSTGNGVSSAERGTAANGNVRVSVEERGRNGAGNSGTGTENRGVNTKFSLKEDSQGRELTEEQREYFKDSKAVDSEGRLLTLYHGTGAKFTVFDKAHIGENFADRGSDLGFYFSPYIEDATGYAREATGYKGKGEIMQVYLNLKNPLVIEDEGWGSAIGQADIRHGDLKRWAQEGGHDGIIVKSTDVEMDDNGTPDAVYIAFSSEQIKNVTNQNPTRNPDIRYSIKEYTDEEKQQHVKDAVDYFGRTYKWAETGYITTDGKRLDFSGRHEGGPGGYRTVDHRDISDALGDDYGGGDYSGSMVQFMSEGNIRISPESGGINLSVMPTKAQLDTLSDFVSKQRGEVVLDLDTTDGNTVSSTEYPRGTHANKVLADIKAYFQDGQEPYVSEISRFRNSSKAYVESKQTAALAEENRLLREKMQDYRDLLRQESEKFQKNQAYWQRQNEKLQESRDYWKGQTQRTQRATTDKKAVAAAAKKLIQNYQADLHAADIQGDLQSLYDYIASGYDGQDELTYPEARRRAEAIAEKLIESAVEVDRDLYDEYADLRQYLREQPIIVSDEIKQEIPDYGDFRKSLRGRLKLKSGQQTNIDQVFQELSSEWPGYFNEGRSLNVVDQLERIADVADSLYTIRERNPYSQYMDQAITDAANEIMETFFDLPQTRKTFADQQALKLENAKAKGREQVQKVREQNAARLAERKARSEERLYQAILGEKMAGGRELAKQKRLDAERMNKVREQNAARLAELRERNRQRVLEVIARERESRDQKLAKLKEKYAEKDMASKERQKARELRAKITRHTKKLSEKLLQHHIPESLRGPVAAMLESINLESQYTIGEDGKRVKNDSGAPTKRTEAFQALKEQYAKIAKEGGDITIDPSLLGSDAEGIQGGFDAVIAMKDTKLAEMSREQLQTVWNVVKAVEHSVKTAGDILSQAKYARTADWAQALTTGTASRRPKGSLTKNHVMIDLETPYTYFSHYGEAGKAIYRMLRDAQDQQQLMVNSVADAVRGIVDPKTVKTLEGPARTFTTERGETLTLTTAQVMELYELSKRKQAVDHLLKGGVVQPEVKSEKIRRGGDSIRLTMEDLAAITGTLTEEQKRIADGLQRLTTGILADYGNQASMAAYGYRKFTEADYWPIQSSREGLHSSVEKNSGNPRSIKNIGMAKTTTPNAGNPLDLPGIFATFSRHASDMTDYAAWLCTMEDVNRIYNFQFRDENGDLTGKTVKNLLDQYGGPGSQKYWYNLMKDIQNGINEPSDSPMWDTVGKTIGGFKGAAVAGNIRVVIQQPTAFFRAAAVLDPKDMARGLAGGVTKGNGWKKALQYSPIAMRKDAGGFDIASPHQMNDTLFDQRSGVRKLNDKLSAPAGKADAVTWGKLWNACEWATAREHQGLTKGSEAFYRQTAKLFAEVIDQTQVVDGVLQRANIMRSSNAVVKQATSFMGEPIMSLNLMMRSADQVRYEQDSKKRGKALKTMGRAATALVVTNVVNALAQSLIDAARDDDEDKKYWERFWAAFTGITGDEKTAWEKAWNAIMQGNVGSNMNPLDQIPFVKDALSIMQGYDVSRTEMEVVADLIQAGQTVIQSAGGNGKKTRAYAVKELLAAGSKLFGLPVSNITRDLWALVRTVAVETDNIPVQYEMEKAIYNITNASNKNRYYAILYRALEQGDMDTYQHIRDDLMNTMGLDGAQIDSAMKSRYNKAVKQDADYTLPQKARDQIGSRDKVSTEEKETEETFGADDLDSRAYQAYSTQRGEDYRSMANSLDGNPVYRDLDDETRDKVQNAIYELADKGALADNSGGQYEITTKWILNAREAKQKYAISPATYALLKVQASEAKSLKDKNGDTIANSKNLQIMEAIYNYQPRLSDTQRQAMFEYLDVGKSVRHLNKAAVQAKLDKLRRQAQ